MSWAIIQDEARADKDFASIQHGKSNILGLENVVNHCFGTAQVLLIYTCTFLGGI